MIIDDINSQLEKHIETVVKVREQLAGPIADCVQVLIDALHNGHKVLTMGNGGSAADAQHFAAELIGRFLMERKALPAIALTTDTSILTAIGNDYGFDDIFKRQVEALVEPGDVVFGISTSGKSENVKRAIETSRNMGAKTIGLLGCGGGDIASMVDLDLTVPGTETPRIQESHLVIIHIICDLVEKGLFCAESE